MATLLKLFFLVLSAAAALIAAASQIGPEEAVSNIAAWARYLGIDSFPVWLTSQAADNVVGVVAAIVSVAAIALMFLLRRTRRSKPGITDDPVAPASSESVPDLTLREAISFVEASTDWFHRRSFQALEDAAALGVVRVWGRKKRSQTMPLMEIPTECWSDLRMELRFGRDGMPDQSFAKRDLHPQSVFYDLRFLRSEVANAISSKPDLGIDRKASSEPPIVQSPETRFLMRDIGRLKELLLGRGPYESVENEVAESFRRIEKSDHLIWLLQPSEQLRRDFLNRCGIIVDDRRDRSGTREELEEAKNDMKALADRLVAELKMYRGM